MSTTGASTTWTCPGAMLTPPGTVSGLLIARSHSGHLCALIYLALDLTKLFTCTFSKLQLVRCNYRLLQLTCHCFHICITHGSALPGPNLLFGKLASVTSSGGWRVSHHEGKARYCMARRAAINAIKRIHRLNLSVKTLALFDSFIAHPILLYQGDVLPLFSPLLHPPSAVRCYW
jgi:hypothetical protein